MNDKLNRQEEAEFLVNYLEKRFEIKEQNDSFVLNVNAKWGYGKTFFLNLIKKNLESKDYEVVYFDAWENDFTKDPLLAFFSEINDSLEKYFEAYNQKEVKPFFKNIFKSSLPILASVLTKQLVGLSSAQLDDLLNEEESEGEKASEEEKDTQKTFSSIMSKTTEIALIEHNTIKKSIKEFKKNMSTLLGLIKETVHKELPLFILIDELDRCRPNYAIELLENIKHIFDIPGIYFVIATNSKQLSHSINSIYGQNFSSEVYLKRFFHQEYNLKEPNKYEYIKFLLEKEITEPQKFATPLLENKYPDLDLNAILLNTYVSYFKLTLRDIEQSINILSTICLIWDNPTEKIHLPYLVFFIMAKQKNNKIFESQKYEYNSNKINELHQDEVINKNVKIRSELLNTSDPFKSTRSDLDIKIEVIMQFYQNFIDEPVNNLRRDSDNLLFRKYQNDLQRNMASSLKKYPELVESAAQLK